MKECCKGFLFYLLCIRFMYCYCYWFIMLTAPYWVYCAAWVNFFMPVLWTCKVSQESNQLFMYTMQFVPECFFMMQSWAVTFQQGNEYCFWNLNLIHILTEYRYNQMLLKFGFFILPSWSGISALSICNYRCCYVLLSKHSIMDV